MAHDIQHQIESTIQAFAADLEALVRRAALAAVADALGTGETVRRGPGRPKGTREKPAKASVKAIPSSSKPVQISSALLRVLAHIRNHPGQRSEQIRDALDLAKPSWVKASTQLLAEGKITKQGTRRSTTYNAK